MTRPVFSPDGRHVAFSAYETVSDPDTYLRRLYVSAPDGAGLTAIADTYEEPTDWLG
ncbi:hypothetical protein AB0M20_34725 [Actinoplanes sp. NPDC051633]|uniref:hypothetical protein n=1 Tax=Actinoplanes sp. NPDC051633 TaxID=3155670 RepID=UPI00341E0FC2